MTLGTWVGGGAFSSTGSSMKNYREMRIGEDDEEM